MSIQLILSLLGGLALFLYGMQMMSGLVIKILKKEAKSLFFISLSLSTFLTGIWSKQK